MAVTRRGQATGGLGNPGRPRPATVDYVSKLEAVVAAAFAVDWDHVEAGVAAFVPVAAECAKCSATQARLDTLRWTLRQFGKDPSP